MGEGGILTNLELFTDQNGRLLEEEAVKIILAEKALPHFMQQAWKIVEPETNLIWGWHLDAICDHLMAVFNGDIRKLIINIPPRHTKSITVAVMWPAWSWIKNPGTKWLFSSYAKDLSLRDSVKCRRLIQSPWYQDNWGDKCHIVEDQNQKVRFENNYGGYRLATSVDGQNTGEGGDFVICLPYESLIATPDGPIKIGDIIERKLNVRILSFDPLDNVIELDKIEEYQTNPVKNMIEIELDNGETITVTEDHEIYTENRGYVQAQNLTEQDKVLVAR